MNDTYAAPVVIDRGEVLRDTLEFKKITGPEQTGHLPASGSDLSFGL